MPLQERKNIMSIISTNELFRVQFSDKGDYMALMRQTYTDDKPFYWLHESHLPYNMSVDSSSCDLHFIAAYIERSIKLDEEYAPRIAGTSLEVLNTYKKIISSSKLFLRKLKEFAAAEYCGNQQAIAQQPQP